ncbi:MAG: hypothetical protein EA419_02870 [Wenzhouxiangella sp.]|nr:MAG: hypothetical protein EA419_02870 [Wenzhouxiangella sp.]
MRALLILVLAGLAAACATTVPTEVRTGEIYQRHASEESVSSVIYGSIRSWRPAGDEAVLIEFSRNRHYLFELDAPCRTEIPFAQSIRLITSTAQRVDRFDRIRVGESTCRILDIREVDFDAVRADLEALRQQPEAGRDSVDTDVIHRDDYSGGT